MKIIYYCYGSAHSSITAAAIHLGKLPINFTPSVNQILSLPDFDFAGSETLGNLFHKGTDEFGFDVYTMGLGSEQEIVVNSLQSLIREADHNPDDFLFTAALPQINRLAKIGGALSRRYGLVTFGRKLAARGICQSYDKLVNLVTKTKQELIKRKEMS